MKTTQGRLCAPTSLALTLLLAVTALCAALPGAARADDDAAARPPASGFELDSLDGEEFSLDDLEGEVVIISFWATWCMPCMQELPHLEAMYREHEDDGLMVLAIATDGPDTVSGVRSIVEQEGWTMPILLDQEGSVSAVLNPRGTNPFTVFIDRHGRVAYEHEGYSAGDEAHYLELVQALLAEDAP